MNAPLVNKISGNQGEDAESALVSTAVERHISSQASKNRMSQHQNNTEATTNTARTAERDQEQSIARRQQPPWKCDKRIYESRFIRSAFWASQLGIFGLWFIFIILYFQLFIPVSVSNHSKLQVTIATDYGLWFIVSCTILGWLGMAILLLFAGAIFSSLFKIER